MKRYPAVDVAFPADLLLALVDDFSPAAVEERDEVTRVFFASPDARDAACTQLRAAGYRTDPIDVADEDWARRSQENLTPVTVGRITIAPPWAAVTRPPAASAPSPPAPSRPPLLITIEPSMGFGTGHHETTRLCLEALQTIDLTGAFVLDVGTGSGVLAIAADLLGAARTLGVDHDPDAIQCARENLPRNPAAGHTAFVLRDLDSASLPSADLVTANLTGALLVRTAGRLLGALSVGGTLILSGILAGERDTVRRAYAAATLSRERRDGEWICLTLKKR